MKKNNKVIFIAASLPYGLKVIAEKDPALVSVAAGYNADSESVLIRGFGENSHSWTSIERVKPLLRPILSLDKPIKEGGCTIEPMFELLKLATYIQEGTEVSYEKSQECVFLRFVNNIGEKSIFTYNAATQTFGILVLKPRGSIYSIASVLNQNVLFNKLIQWHFDIYNLIDTKEAVSIEDFNPYDYES